MLAVEQRAHSMAGPGRAGGLEGWRAGAEAMAFDGWANSLVVESRCMRLVFGVSGYFQRRSEIACDE